MNRAFRRAWLVAAIIVAFLPIVELGDRWESYGSDPEFVSVITVAAICLGFLLFRRDVVFALRRLLLRAHLIPRLPAPFCRFLSRQVRDGLPDIRGAPIRI